VWVEDADKFLTQDRTFELFINIGGLRTNALTSPTLPPIDWGIQNELPILVVLSGRDFSVKPRCRRILLPKHGDTTPVSFEITPLKTPSSTLRISFYLERELALLEEFEVPITTKPAKWAA
jgi:hypothetical protein